MQIESQQSSQAHISTGSCLGEDIEEKCCKRRVYGKLSPHLSPWEIFGW